MDKLLEIKIGGGSVHSGWVPLSALGMLRDLLDAIAEEGTDEEIWKAIDPQVEVVGRNSTLLAVHTNFAGKLRPQVKAFREKAQRLTLGQKGRAFVGKHVATPSARWAYVELIEVPAKKEEKPDREKAHLLRFDARYRERYLQRQSEPIHGFDEIHAVVIRAGGSMPTVTLGFLGNGTSGTYPVRGRDLAKRIAARLYDTVKIKAEVWWNAKTMEIEKLVVHDLLDWRDAHLAEIYREHGGRLPVSLTVKSVEELLDDREDEREETGSEFDAAALRA